MSVNKKELIAAIEKIAPKELMEDWDNTGIQISCGGNDVKRVLVCLDICSETIDEAIENDCDFIVSHHPLIFSPIRSINQSDAAGGYIVRLIENGISVYASHTSFDTVKGGNNDYISEILDLQEVRAPEEEPIMRVGILKERMMLRKLCSIVNSKIMMETGLTFSGNPEGYVEKVGICTGAGSSVMQAAVKQGCDVLITGDVKYHDAQQGLSLGISMIDAGHFETEIFFTENMGEKLQNALGEKIEVFESKNQKNTLTRFFEVV